jgi:hypothetical protein
MTGLREMFEELASAPAPPSPAVGARLYAEGRRRRQRRRVALAGALAAVVAAVVALGGVVAQLPDRGRSVPAVSPPAERRVPQSIQWVGAADATHLYAGVPTCADAVCVKGNVRVQESVDAGRTWSPPGDPVSVGDLAVVAPGTLIGTAPGGDQLVSSVDGGRTWDPLKPSGGTVASGGPLLCLGEEGCTVAAADLARHIVTPLTQAPPITVVGSHSLFSVAGTTYVTGRNSQSQRPAVAWTRDGGQSWASHTFADVVACTAQQCSEPRITSVDGISAYAELNQPFTNRRLTYYTSGQGWTSVASSTNVPYAPGGAPAPFIAKDGTYVIAEWLSREGPDGLRFWALRDEGFVETDLKGLPSTAYRVNRTPDGWFFTLVYPAQVLYGSTDGWSWYRVIN